MKNPESQELWGVFSRNMKNELFLTRTEKSQDAAERSALSSVKNGVGSREVYLLTPCCKYSNSPHREPL